jgi:hypothetical protein
MTEKKFQELTIWGEDGERDLLLLLKNVISSAQKDHPLYENSIPFIVVAPTSSSKSIYHCMNITSSQNYSKLVTDICFKRTIYGSFRALNFVRVHDFVRVWIWQTSILGSNLVM